MILDNNKGQLPPTVTRKTCIKWIIVAGVLSLVLFILYITCTISFMQSHDHGLGGVICLLFASPAFLLVRILPRFVYFWVNSSVWASKSMFPFPIFVIIGNFIFFLIILFVPCKVMHAIRVRSKTSRHFDKKSLLRLLLIVIIGIVVVLGLKTLSYWRISKRRIDIQETLSKTLIPKVNLSSVKLGTIPPEHRYDLKNVTFSPDGRHFAYTAYKNFNSVNAKRVFVFDGAEKELEIPYEEDSIGRSYLLGYFSPTGAHSVFIDHLRDKEFLVLDGNKTAAYDYIYSYFFSPNEHHLAYLVQKGRKSFVVIDGKESKIYDYQMNEYSLISKIVFSPDDKHIAYILKQKGKSVVIKARIQSNDKMEEHVIDKPYDEIDSLCFDSGNSLTYMAENNGMGVIIKNGQEVKQFPISNYRCIRNFTFSPNCKHFAFSASVRNKVLTDVLVFDGKEVASYKGVNNITFSPDGTHLAYVVPIGHSHFQTMRDGEIIADEKGINLIFSSNSQHLAYKVKKIYTKHIPPGEWKNNMALFLDEKEISRYKAYDITNDNIYNPNFVSTQNALYLSYGVIVDYELWWKLIAI